MSDYESSRKSMVDHSIAGALVTAGGNVFRTATPVSLAGLLTLAWTVHPDQNSDYTRGQVNLIMDLCGLSGDSIYEVLTSVVSHGLPLNAGMDAVQALVQAGINGA